MTRLPQVLRNVHVRRPGRLALGRGQSGTRCRSSSRELGDKGRVLLRASGTEAVVRVMVEAPTHELASEVVERLVAVGRARA